MEAQITAAEARRCKALKEMYLTYSQNGGSFASLRGIATNHDCYNPDFLKALSVIGIIKLTGERSQALKQWQVGEPNLAMCRRIMEKESELKSVRNKRNKAKKKTSPGHEMTEKKDKKPAVKAYNKNGMVAWFPASVWDTGMPQKSGWGIEEPIRVTHWGMPKLTPEEAIDSAYRLLVPKEAETPDIRQMIQEEIKKALAPPVKKRKVLKFRNPFRNPFYIVTK